MWYLVEEVVQDEEEEIVGLHDSIQSTPTGTSLIFHYLHENFEFGAVE